MLREVKLNSEDFSSNRRPGSYFGVPQRVWLVIGAIVGLTTFSRFLYSSPETTNSYYSTGTHLLSSRDYLNASSLDPAPFDFCPVFGPNDLINERRGQWGLLKSRLHTGSGARIQRLVQKAMAGLPVTISVLGGSVSACHGAGDDPMSSRCYPTRFFDWWNSVFPHPGNELTNGAARRTDSAYFAYCHMHHLPDHVDLVILEFDATDPNDPQWLNYFELLVRSILIRPEAPAVIILGHFAPQIQAQNGFAGPELLHTVVAQFYDVPHISAKGILYQEYLTDPEEARAKFFTDPVLANPAGHDLISDILVSYLQTQICAGWAATMGHAFDVPYMGAPLDPEASQTLLGTSAAKLRGDAVVVGSSPASPFTSTDLDAEGGSVDSKLRAIRVPQAKLSDRPSDILQFREVSPFCVSADDLINPLPPSHFFGSGWLGYHPPKGAAVEEKHYWYSEIPGSRLRVPVTLGSGDVMIYYLQNPEDRPQGRAACWVDDNYANAVELSGNANVHEALPTLTKIDENVASGPHYVECVLLGEEGTTSPPFRLLGIFTT